MAYRLCVARPTGYRMQHADISTWLMQFAFRLRDDSPDIREVQFYNVGNPRILMMRNLCVKDAVAGGCSHILFVDPDMVPDKYVGRDPTAKMFWLEAWTFIKEHPGSVVAVPYCGPPPDEVIHVFVKNDKGDLVRLPRAAAQKLSGWKGVEAVGTGLLLADMSIFQKIPHPYFDDVYLDDTKTKLHFSQDVYFCLKCREHGIPIYVNFDCWAGHDQTICVDKPGWREAMNPPAPPLPLAAHGTIPVLTVRGQGDTRWK